MLTANEIFSQLEVTEALHNFVHEVTELYKIEKDYIDSWEKTGFKENYEEILDYWVNRAIKAADQVYDLPFAILYSEYGQQTFAYDANEFIKLKKLLLSGVEFSAEDIFSQEEIQTALSDIVYGFKSVYDEYLSDNNFDDCFHEIVNTWYENVENDYFTKDFNLIFAILNAESFKMYRTDPVHFKELAASFGIEV